MNLQNSNNTENVRDELSDYEQELLTHYPEVRRSTKENAGKAPDRFWL